MDAKYDDLKGNEKNLEVFVCILSHVDGRVSCFTDSLLVAYHITISPAVTPYLE